MYGSEADVLIADLSEHNPNVFYELGIAHALTNKTIMISSDEDIPFDLSPYRVIRYKHAIGGADHLATAIRQAAIEVLGGQSEPSNPAQAASLLTPILPVL